MVLDTEPSTSAIRETFLPSKHCSWTQASSAVFHGRVETPFDGVPWGLPHYSAASKSPENHGDGAGGGCALTLLNSKENLWPALPKDCSGWPTSRKGTRALSAGEGISSSSHSRNQSHYVLFSCLEQSADQGVDLPRAAQTKEHKRSCPRRFPGIL